MSSEESRSRELFVVGSSGAILLAGVVLSALTWSGDAGRPLFFVLLGVAVLAQIVTTTVDHDIDSSVSGVFLCAVLAIGFLDPACAFAIPVVTNLVWGIIGRKRRQALLVNTAGQSTPDAFAAWIVGGLALAHTGVAFPLVLAAAGAAVLIINIVFVDVQMNLLDGLPASRVALHREYLGPAALNIALAAALAEVYVQTGLAVIEIGRAHV